MNTTPPRILTIAGSDNSGGAGIQADLKTVSVLGGYGMSVLTAVTAQNTQGVESFEAVSAALVEAQLRTIMDDVGVDAAKTGMLANAAIIEVVARHVAAWEDIPLVVDPVMVSTSGHRLLAPEAEEALKTLLLPHALLVTPNLPEAEALVGATLDTEGAIVEAGTTIREMGSTYVLIKGGHSDDRLAVDVLIGPGGVQRFEAPRIDTTSTHGTGCTYSAAIATYLGQGAPLEDAIDRAKHYLTEAIKRAFPLGKGHGPVYHGWPLGER